MPEINEFVPFRFKRLLAFLDPWADPTGSGYHVIQSMLAIGSGGIWGLGLSQGRQKLFYLPEPHTDFIFAVIGEELGLLGAVAVVAVFGILAWRGLRAAGTARTCRQATSRSWSSTGVGGAARCRCTSSRSTRDQRWRRRQASSAARTAVR